jgi:polyisoprenoid-binding protein YceI
MTTPGSATLTPAAAPAATATWNIDASHSHVEFAIRHLMISTVKGRFADVKGAVVLNDADLTQSTVDVTIGVASIDTRVGQRDDHLRSADFFEVERFPQITFTSTRVEADGDELRVVGNLTIRDVTKEVTLAVTSEGRGRDPWGGERAGFSATTKIAREDFGLTYNQALETGGVLLGNDIKIAIEVELVKA